MQPLDHLDGGQKGICNVDTLGGPQLVRLGFLVRRFHAQVERQRRADAELIAGLERVARNPRTHAVIKQILQEIEV